MSGIGLALVLNLHQPSGNIEHLLDTREREAKEILWAMDRIPRSLWGYEDVARVHLALSGTLLETLSQPQFQERVYGIIDCGSLLWYLNNPAVIDILGSAYYHPILSLIPPADWAEQIERWQGIGGHLFNRPRFNGFWPPEMGFAPELIPLLRRLGYRYVLVDSEHVEPVGSLRWEEIRYRPHVARFGAEQITVVVRDRDLSNAQEAGMEVDWFLAEVAARTQHCDFPPLVTTCSDGENGGWFRDAGHNYWSAFYQPLLERVRRGESGGLSPTFIDDYLDRYGTHGEVTVRTGGWNIGWHQGTGFGTWTGSDAQQEALTRVGELSQAVHAARRNATGIGAADPNLYRLLEEAYWHVLRAETSCNFFWGTEWVHRCHDDLNQAARFLDLAADSPAQSPGLTPGP